MPLPLLHVTDRGLYCEAGDFYVDPWSPPLGSRAIITHAHGDHAHGGAAEYLTSTPGAMVLRERLGPGASVTAVEYGEEQTIGGVRVSLHPAGHILGSAQIRLERAGEVWVVSGDYKIEADPTCAPFEPVRCNVFITESTFGLPIYRWTAATEVHREINAWWSANAAAGRTSIIFGYSLGKAQRIMAGLDPSIGPVLVHGAVQRLLGAYAEAGVKLPPSAHATRENVRDAGGRGMVIAPPSAADSPWARGLGEASSAMASGWMRIRGTRRRQSLDRGFVLSDHADWPGLLGAIEATGAERIGVTHGYTGPLVRRLREHGREAWEVPTRFVGETAREDEASGEEGRA